MRVKKGDTVRVMSGNDKGKEGKVLKVFPATSRVIVEKINLIKRHSRATQTNPQGGIVEKEAPIHISNVALMCDACTKPTRVGFKEAADGKKVRFCKKCNEVID